jgi:hypothetical protein
MSLEKIVFSQVRFLVVKPSRSGFEEISQAIWGMDMRR